MTIVMYHFYAYLMTYINLGYSFVFPLISYDITKPARHVKTEINRKIISLCSVT